MNEEFFKKNLAVSWIIWRFYESPRSLFFIWKNFLEFNMNFFSIHLLFATILSPWRRLQWRYPRAFSPQEYLGVFISNIFSRIIGFVLKSILIVVGVMAEIAIFIFGLAAILFWMVLPMIAAILIIFFFYV